MMITGFGRQTDMRLSANVRPDLRLDRFCFSEFPEHQA
jgi:hypothetical protein